jgi:hypothetical protein
MRRIGALALLLLLPAGCAARAGGPEVATVAGTPAASASATAAADDPEAPLKFSQCMREQGMTWFPDPAPGKGMQIKVPAGTDKAKMDAAMAACKKFMPNGGAPEKPDPAMIEALRQVSKCMRENGVPNFPDPSADGRMELNGEKLGGVGPGNPAFDAAEKKCDKFQPTGAAHGRTTANG